MDNSSKTWLNQGHEFWDQTLLKDLLKDLPETERQTIIVPGAINTVEEVNKEISKYSKVLVIITSDEEHLFPIKKLIHEDMKIYVTYPDPEKHLWADRLLPIGYPPMPEVEFTSKKLPWFFAGQINHQGRENLVKVLRELSGGKLIETEGFSQGLEYPEYLKWMSLTSVIPCPGGQSSPDSFRLYEALELGCIPIVDNKQWWDLLYDSPFPRLDDWSTLPALIDNLKDRPEQNNICQAWWMRQKRQMRWNLEDDLGIKPQEITVLIPTSPIPSHPSIDIIKQTIESIRERLDCEIILMIDGVRDEQQDRQKNYTEYIRRLLWEYRGDNVYPIIFNEHQHQANMAREALKHVRTSKILYVEHDTPLTGEIPFEEISELIDSKANIVRLMHEANILEPHKYLMLDEGRFTKTAQWSQRPHIASTDYYRRIVEEHFPPTGRTMIEDRMHGVLMNAYQTKGLSGWNEHKVYIYTPEGDMKRSLNLDGREADSKYEMKYE